MAVSCNAEQLAAAATGFYQVPTQSQKGVWIYLLCAFLNGTTVAACDAESLVAASKTYQPPHLSSRQQDSVISYLLCQIAQNGGGGGGGASQLVQYTADPNTEGKKPANTAANAVAYSADGSGAFFGWDINTQSWV